MKTIKSDWGNKFEKLLNVYIEGFANYKKPSLYRELRADRDTKNLYDFISQVEQSAYERGFYEGSENVKESNKIALKYHIENAKEEGIKMGRDVRTDQQFEYKLGKIHRGEEVKKEIIKEIEGMRKCTCGYREARKFIKGKGLVHNKDCGKIYDDIISKLKSLIK